MQRSHRLVLDLVGAGELARNELGVVDDLDLARAEGTRACQPEQERAVLGDVVRGLSEQLGGLVEDASVGCANDGRRSCRPGIAPSAAVDIENELQDIRSARRRRQRLSTRGGRLTLPRSSRPRALRPHGHACGRGRPGAARKERSRQRGPVDRVGGDRRSPKRSDRRCSSRRASRRAPHHNPVAQPNRSSLLIVPYAPPYVEGSSATIVAPAPRSRPGTPPHGARPPGAVAVARAASADVGGDRPAAPPSQAPSCVPSRPPARAARTARTPCARGGPRGTRSGAPRAAVDARRSHRTPPVAR